MFKLLPPDEKHKVEGEYKLRRAAVFIFAISIVGVLSAAALFPSYVLTSDREVALQERINALSHSSNQEDANALKVWAESVHHKLALLAPSGEIEKPYEFFQNILAARPKGVKVKGLSWTKKNTSGTVSVAGVALDRQSLLAFESALSASKHFAPVNFPISDLAQDSNIEFQFDLTPA